MCSAWQAVTMTDPARSALEATLHRALLALDEHVLVGPNLLNDTAAIGSARLGELDRLFDIQVASRHCDLAARWLRSQGKGFYTISSAGHESNAAVSMALR